MLCRRLVIASRECSSKSFLPCVSRATTFSAQIAASRAFWSLSARYRVMTRTPSAFRASLRPCWSLPQCQRNRRHCRTISQDSAGGATTTRPSGGTNSRNLMTLSSSPQLKTSRTPSRAYMVTAARVCRRYRRQSARGFVAGWSGSVAQRYCAMLLTLPWSTTCWQPSRKIVTALNVAATFIFTSSSSQLSSSFASLGSVGPEPTAFVRSRAMAVLPTGRRLRPPMRSARLPMTRAASRRTGMLSCIRRFVQAAMTSEQMAVHFCSWLEHMSQTVQSASTSTSGAMPGDCNCSTRRGKRRSPLAMLT
mmetsp:Transcript_22568/g.59603  ORF Transcript_22568/g.59603 Transcript_22568/m.59603 type:complete len:307 (+) Transcript_22568:572-1492(+)